MAEVFFSFDTTISDGSGRFHPRVVGRQASDGMWEGWLEFVPVDGNGETLVTAVESRQPEHSHLAYWATGLSDVYAEGALKRARNPLTVVVRMPESPASEAPASQVTRRFTSGYGSNAVLNPFDIAAGSLDILRQELGALNRPRLLNIINEHNLNPSGEDLAWMSDDQLVKFIVVAVDAQMTQRR